MDSEISTSTHLRIDESNMRSGRERVLRGRNGWWFVGPGGIARLGETHVTSDGRLQPQAEQQLRRQGMFKITPYRGYSLTVLTSTDCNLGCGYCFQNASQDASGGNRPLRIAHSRLTSSTISAILDFTRSRMADAGLDQLLLMLFGGEPLLNLRGCRELLTRAADYGLARATMTSNGTLLTPLIAKELSSLGLRSVQVTFDGDRPEHDRIRATRAGRETFDVITENIANVSDVAPIQWTLRINVSHRNHQGISDLLERLAERIDPARCVVSLARVGDIGIGYSNHLTLTGNLASAFADWYRKALNLGFQVTRPHVQGPCQACSYKSGRYGAVISADGTLSSCWETAGKPNWAVGTVTEGYLPDAEIADRWTSCAASYQYADDRAEFDRFEDRVDAELLDHLSAIGRL